MASWVAELVPSPTDCHTACNRGRTLNPIGPSLAPSKLTEPIITASRKGMPATWDMFASPASGTRMPSAVPRRSNTEIREKRLK